MLDRLPVKGAKDRLTRSPMSANGDGERPDGAASSEVTHVSQPWPGAEAPRAGDGAEAPRAGDLSAETNRADIGTSDTLIADHGVATITADAARTQKPLPPPRRRWWLLVGAMVAVVVAGSIATALEVSLEPDRADIGVDVMRLPPATTMVVTGHARSDLLGRHAASPGELASWWAAAVCGGFDVARALELAAGGDLRLAQSLGLGALSAPAALRKPLACGRKLAESLGQGRVTEIAWSDGATKRRVIGVWLDEPVAPDWAKGKPGFLNARTFFTGSGDDIEAFESGARREHAAGLMGELVDASTAAESTLLSSSPTTVDLTLPCLLAAPAKSSTAFLRHCFPARFADENESLAVKLRGLSVSRDVPTHSGRLRLELVFVAKDEAAADIVQESLRAFWKETLAMVNHFEVDLAKLAKQEAATGALFDPWLRALRHTTITRHGAHIRLVAEAALGDDELERARGAAKSPTTTSKDVDAIVTALATDEPVPVDALERIVGGDVATWLVSTFATAADCAAIVAHAEALPVDEERFGLRFSIQSEWAKDKCAEHLLPASTRHCLVGAKDIVSMSQCALPVHPDVKQARALLTGAWIATEGDTSLRFAGDQATFVLDGVTGAGGWTLRSAGDQSAVVALPVRAGAQSDFIVERLGDDRLRLRRDALTKILTKKEQR